NPSQPTVRRFEKTAMGACVQCIRAPNVFVKAVNLFPHRKDAHPQFRPLSDRARLRCGSWPRGRLGETQLSCNQYEESGPKYADDSCLRSCRSEREQFAGDSPGCSPKSHAVLPKEIE